MHPDIVSKMHLEYLSSGASVITTNSYSCIPATISLANQQLREDEVWDTVRSYTQVAGMRATETRNEFIDEQFTSAANFNCSLYPSPER